MKKRLRYFSRIGLCSDFGKYSVNPIPLQPLWAAVGGRVQTGLAVEIGGRFVAVQGAGVARLSRGIRGRTVLSRAQRSTGGLRPLGGALTAAGETLSGLHPSSRTSR